MTNTGTATLIEAHPSLIELETNIRTEAAIDAGFLASIRANGVLTPVLGHRNEGGTVMVRAGQRRVLAAREAGLDTIPVCLVENTDAEADRIVRQLLENEQRDSMTDVDKVAAFKTLELEGLSVAARAKRTGAKRDEIKTSIAVTDNATAATAIKEHAMTVDQAVVLMEFDGDDAPARSSGSAQHVSRPSSLTRPSAPATTAPVLRSARRSSTRSPLRASDPGLSPRILRQDPVNVSRYATAKGDTITEDTLAGLDGASAYVQVYGGGSVDLTLYIEDPKAHGFKKRAASGEARTPMADEQKAERTVLIENNKQ